MSPQPALLDKISEVEKLIKRFQGLKEKQKAPPPPPPPTDLRSLLFRQRPPFLTPQLPVTRAPVSGVPPRPAFNLGELLRQRQPISPVSARVTAPSPPLPTARPRAGEPGIRRREEEILGIALPSTREVPLSDAERQRILRQGFWGKQPIPPAFIEQPLREFGQALETPTGQAVVGAVGVAGMVLGVGIPAAQQSWRALTNLALMRQISRWATERNVAVSKEEAQLFANRIRSFATQKGFKWDLDKKVLRDIFKPIGGRTVPSPEATQKAEETAQQAVNRFAPAIIPKGTQTGAMAFGGREARLSQQVWDMMPVAQRVAQAQSAGLSGQVGSKTFEALTVAEKTALGKVAAPVAPAPGVVKLPISAQPGLPGVGPAAVQAQAFQEFGTAPGMGGVKPSLLDVAAIKTAEAGKPLAGQMAMELPSVSELQSSILFNQSQIRELESLLSAGRKRPPEWRTKADLQSAIASLKAEISIAETIQYYQANEGDLVDVLGSVRRTIADIEGELGNRSMPYHGRATNIFPNTTTKELDAQLKTYQNFVESVGASQKPPISEEVVKAEPAPVSTGVTTETNPLMMTSAEFNARFPRLRDLPAAQQQELLDMLNETNLEETGVDEPLSLVTFVQDMGDMRFDLETGGAFTEEHQQMIEEAAKRGDEIAPKVRAEYQDIIDKIERKKSQARALAEKKRQARSKPAPTAQPTVTAKAQAGKPLPAGKGKVPPAKPPPAEPPTGKPPIPPTANDLPPSITPGPMASNIIGLRTIEPGLVRSELLGNIIKRTVSKGLVKAGIQPFIEADPLANPAMRERFRVKTAIESQSALIGAKSEQAVRKAFIFDKQSRVPALKGINPDIAGAPTIQDVAARLPTYDAVLTPEQKTALATLRAMIEPYHSLMTEVGIEIPQRPDVMDGGFYLPRGRAALEGADAPVKIRAGLGKGTKKGFERPAYFTSQSEGIEKGYEYATLGDALSAYAFDAGVRATDAHIVNYFKALTDETGALIGETPKMRLLRQSPELVKKMEKLKEQLDKLKRLSGALTERQMEVIDLWQHDPEFDDLDTLLSGLATMRGGKKPSYTSSELASALKEARESIRALRPEYKVALRRAQVTPREQGTIGLPGLQGRTYPDEIANAANMVLSKEGRTTGALAPAVNVANAFNNLYRGLRATLDDSALGIQGLLGIGAQPRAYKEALKVNIRAWGVGGDKILGKFIENFDAKAATTGRLSSADWAKAELHLGGVVSEFQLGQGFSTKLANLPAVRQANRAFGYFGDALRLDWADGELATQLRKHTLEELQAKGDLERIANAANNMTGWAKGKAFGSVGDLLLFAPRFLQSRLETLAKAGAGLRPNATIDQKMTRNALLRLIGWGTLLTIAINEMLGNDTDFRPVVDGKRNSNFMRINYQGRKYTVFGTWDSLLGMIINVGTGRPLNAVRSMSSGMVTGAWDVLTGRDYNYNAVRDTPANFAKWLMGSFVPFAAQDIPSMAKGAVQGAKTGEAEKVIGGGIGIGTQLVGVKSYEVSPTYELKIKWASDFKLYDDIPTDPDEAKAQKKPTRTAYRKAYPDIEAKLFITGRVDTISSDMAIEAVIKLARENKIDPDTIRGVKANKEKWADIEAGKRTPPTRVSFTDKLVARLSRLEETPTRTEKEQPPPKKKKVFPRY